MSRKNRKATSTATGRGPLRRAWSLHAAGRDREAGDLARAHLGGDAAADALHLLGLMALAGNENDRAQHLLADAARRAPEAAAVHNDLGEAERALGRLQQAEAGFRRALELEPAHVLASNNLGLVLMMRGDAHGAIAAFKRALSLDAGFGEAAMNLGNALRETGATAAAIDAYRSAMRSPATALAALMSIGGMGLATGNAALAREGFEALLRRQPGHPRGELGMALLAESSGDEASALTRLRSLVRREPRDAGAWMTLARIAARMRRHTEAVEAFQRVLELEPADVEARAGLVRALMREGRLADAEQQCRRALDNGEWPEMLALLGDVLAMDARPEAAEPVLRRALELDAGQADALNRLGELRMHVGDLDAAAEGFRAALRERPDHPLAWENLAMLPPRLLHPEEDCSRLHACIDDGAPRTPSSSASLRFAAARLLDVAGRYEEAEDMLLTANAIMGELVPFDAVAHQALVDALLAEVDSTLVARLSAQGDQTPIPVFIVGMPRSGTTLLEQMLSRHPQVHAAGEVRFFSQLQVDIGGRRYPYSLRDLDAGTLHTIARRYLQEVVPAGTHPQRVIDKMPINFMQVGLIASVFANARFIHLSRGCDDVGLSLFQQNFTFAEGNAWTYSLAHIARFQVSCERLMAHWRQVVDERILDLAYEALVSEPEAMLRRVLEHVGLSWDERCLDFAGSRRRVLTASAIQVREPVHRRAVGRAAHYPRVIAGLRRERAALGHPGARSAGD